MNPESLEGKDDSNASVSMRAALERALHGTERSAGALTPPAVPDHTLLDRIGQGAYGDVWLARSALGTMRAVKVVYRARFKEDRPYEREFNGILKYEPVSRSHEGLVQVLHVGRGDGCFYYVMELADTAEADGSESVVGGLAPVPSASVTQASSPDSQTTAYTPRTLRSELARRSSLPPQEAAQLILQLTGALAHLHGHGLVHRDIKPSNVIFVRGRPKLADIGLVTDVGSSQSFVGTEGFIPPEGPGTPQADLYALGKMLYELATGRDRMDFPHLPPLARSSSNAGVGALHEPLRRSPLRRPRGGEGGFDSRSSEAESGLRRAEAAGVAQIVAAASAAQAGEVEQSKIHGTNSCATSQVSPPDEVRTGARPGFQGDFESLMELNEVMTRACAPDPKQRYTNATQLQADLNLFLAGRGLRQARTLERALRRLRKLAAAACVFLVIASVTIAFVKNEERHANEQARQAMERARIEAASRTQEAILRGRAEEAERATQRQLRAALLEQARATIRGGELGQRLQALEALQRAAAISNSAELGREALAALALPDFRFEREMAIPQDDTDPLLDPSFARVAVSRGRGPVEIRDVSNGRLLATLPASTNLPVYVRRWSRDGRFLAIKRDYPDGGLTADWEVWDVSAERCVLRLRGMSRDAFCFHPRVPQCIAGHRTNGTAIWNLIDGREVRRFPKIVRPHVLRFSPDGERVAAVSPRPPGMAVVIHDVRDPNAAELSVSPPISEPRLTFDWHPDGHGLAVVDHGNSVHWMDAETGEIGLMGRHKSSAVRAQFSPDGDWLFTGGWEREIICWNARGRRRAFTISLDSTLVQISADGRLCAVTTKTNLQFHAFERPTFHREFAEDLGGLLRQATFSRDGRWLAASAGERVGLWDLATGGPGGISEHGSNTRLFFAPEADELFATRTLDGTPAGFRWVIIPATNATAAPRLNRLPLPRPDGFTSLVLYSNRVVMTTTNGTRIFERDELEGKTGAHKWAPTIPGVSSVSPDARWLGIYRSFGTALHIYQLPDLKPAATLKIPTSLSTVQFSPLGNELAIVSTRPVFRAEFWSTTSWERTRTLTNFRRLLYTPDGRGLWLSKDQRTAGLYDAQTLKPLLLLPPGTLPLAVSPDGQHLAVSVDGQCLQLWNLVAVREEFVRLGLDWEVR